ncbi:hypothetical protein C8Q78DRAFT_1073279 [Trametes maxima]|nr:hypothetical protein C8Q78DRAFT_1073279 [Trametes maxima]
MDIESDPVSAVAPIVPVFPPSPPVVSIAAPQAIQTSRGHQSPAFLSIPTGTHGRSRESLVSATTLVTGSEAHDNNNNSRSPVYTDSPLTAEPATQAHDSEQRDWFTFPMPVSFFVRNRYQQRFTLSSNPDPTEKEIRDIPALNRLQDRPQKLGKGWERFVHPEGQVYFKYQNFFTNSHLYDKDRLSDLDHAVDLLQNLIETHRGQLPDKIEVGVDVQMIEMSKYLCYYVCDMTQEEILWFDDVDIDYLVEEENIPVYHKEHLKHAHAMHFWNHIHMFPHNRTFGEARLKEIHAMFTYYLYDRETSRTSNAPWSAADLHRFAQIMKDIEVKGERVSEYDMVKIARSKSFTAGELLRNYHGTQWARIDSNRSIHRDVTTHVRSWWFKFASWMLFCTPMVYIKRLDEMWVDGRINHQPWRKFVSEIQEDWTASITPSAVILTANVGFLAIQSVDQNGVANPDRSTGQIISYISTLLSIGNIIACTILARQHRPTSYHYAEDAYNYLAERAATRRHAELLAIILSIPTAFFIWGYGPFFGHPIFNPALNSILVLHSLSAFCAAILWVCLSSTSWVTRVCILSVTAFTTALLVLVVKNGEWAPPAMVYPTVTQMKEKLRKIPVQRLTQQVRKISMPLRRKLRVQSEEVDLERRAVED